MAFQTLLELRTRLNTDLGIADSDDEPWGDTAVRDLAIRDGFERLWPKMKRMREEDVAFDGSQRYTLSEVRDVQLVEVASSDGVVREELRNWRNWAVDDDPVEYVLRLPTASYKTGSTLVVSGYAPYKSIFAADETTCDLQDRFTWIPLLGARAFLYRRRYHEFLDYEKHANLNRDNAMDPPTLFTAYQDAEARFQQARDEHAAEVTLPRASKMRR